MSGPLDDGPDTAASGWLVWAVLWVVASTALLLLAGAVLSAADVGAASVSSDGRVGRLIALLLIAASVAAGGMARLAAERRFDVTQGFAPQRLVALVPAPALVFVLCLPAVLGGGAADLLADLPGSSAITGVAGMAIAAAAAAAIGGAFAAACTSRPSVESIVSAWERVRDQGGGAGWR